MIDIFPTTVHFDYDSDTTHLACVSYSIEDIFHFWFILYQSLKYNNVTQINSNVFTPFVFRSNMIYDLDGIEFRNDGNIRVSFDSLKEFKLWIYPGITDILVYCTAEFSPILHIESYQDLTENISGTIKSYDDLKHHSNIFVNKNPFIYINDIYNYKPFNIIISTRNPYTSLSQDCSSGLETSIDEPYLKGSFVINKDVFIEWFSKLYVYNSIGYDSESIYYSYFKYPFRTSIATHFTNILRDSTTPIDNVEIDPSAKVYMFKDSVIELRNIECVEVRDKIIVNEDQRLLNNLDFRDLHPSRTLLTDYKYYTVSPFFEKKEVKRQKYDWCDISQYEDYTSAVISRTPVFGKFVNIEDNIFKQTVILRPIVDNEYHIYHMPKILGTRHIRFKILYSQDLQFNNLQDRFNDLHSWSDVDIAADITNEVDFELFIYDVTGYKYPNIGQNEFLLEVPNPHNLETHLLKLIFEYKSRIFPYLYLVAEFEIQEDYFENIIEFNIANIKKDNLKLWDESREVFKRRSLCTNKLISISNSIETQTLNSPYRDYSISYGHSLSEYKPIQMLYTYDDIYELANSCDEIIPTGFHVFSNKSKIFIAPGTKNVIILNKNNSAITIDVNDLTTSTYNDRLQDLTYDNGFRCVSDNYTNELTDLETARWLFIRSQLDNIDVRNIPNYYDCVDTTTTQSVFLNYYSSNTISSEFGIGVSYISSSMIDTTFNNSVVFISENVISDLLNHYSNGVWLYITSNPDVYIFTEISKESFIEFYNTIGIDIASKYMALPYHFDEGLSEYWYPNLLFKNNIPTSVSSTIFYDPIHNSNISYNVPSDGYYYIQCQGFQKLICHLKLEELPLDRIELLLNDNNIRWFEVDDVNIEPYDMCYEVIEIET